MIVPGKLFPSKLPDFQPPSFSQLLIFPSSSLPSFFLHLSPEKSKPAKILGDMPVSLIIR